MIWSSSHRSTIRSHEFDSFPCVQHKFSSLMRLVSFQITIIRSNQRSRIYEKSCHSKISWDSSKSFGSCVCRFFLPLERTFSRENAISKSETHGRATHNRGNALAFYDALACVTDNLEAHYTEDRIFYRHSAHFVIIFKRFYRILDWQTITHKAPIYYAGILRGKTANLQRHNKTSLLCKCTPKEGKDESMKKKKQ